MGVRATVSHPLVALRMCKVSNMATRTWNHKMLQHQKYVKKNSGVWLRRLNIQEWCLLWTANSSRCCGNSKILRPQLDQCPDLADSYLQAEETGVVSEMRLLSMVSMQRNVAMWNECFTEHAKNTACTSPHFEVHNEKQVGLCW